MIRSLYSQINTYLHQASDPQTIASFKRFFKEAVTFHGVKSSLIKKITRSTFQEIKSRSFTKSQVYDLADTLFKSGYSEEAWIAADLVYQYGQFTPKDFETYERWIATYLDNWAKVDTFCNHTMGDFFSLYPEFLPTLKIWAKSTNLWVRRAAAVSLILPARRGEHLLLAFELADLLLTDSNDLVQKGYGWLLKEASRQHPQEVFDYVISHQAHMPRTAYRYAIEKLPPHLRDAAMKK